MSRELLKGSGIVSFLNIISRLFGLLWNLLLARVFGAGALTDIFFVAFRIPNMLRSFIGEGALTSAFVPVFAEELHKSKEQAVKTLRSVIGLLLIASIFLSILGIIFAPLIISFTAPGLATNPQSFSQAILLTRIVLPYIIFVSIIATINGALNNIKIYGAAPLAQITMNIVLILACLVCFYFNQQTGIIILSAAVLLGGTVQILTMLPSLRKGGLSIWPARPFFTPVTKKIMLLMLPALFGAAIYQISIFLNTLLASLLESGSISWLFYADRVSQLPIGIITISISSVLLPALSTSAASGAKDRFALDLSNTLRFINFLIIPCATAVFLLADPIVRIFFQRGNFNDYDSRMTIQAIQATSLGLWGVSFYTIINKAFLAKKDTSTPAILGTVTLLLSFIFSLFFMGAIKVSELNLVGQTIADLQKIISNLFPVFSLGHAGLPLASGLAMTLTMVLSYFLLTRKYSAPPIQDLLPSFLKSSLASIGMAGSLYYTINFFSDPWLQLSLGLIHGLISFFLIALIAKSTEAKQTLDALFSLIRRIKSR